MTQLTVRTKISDTYPLPSNDDAKLGLAAMYDVLKECTEAAEIDLASGATTDIGAQTTRKLRITGTTGITSFGTTYTGPIVLRFSGALTITHNATTLICPGGVNITTEAGDSCMVYPKCTTSGTFDGWIISSYLPVKIDSFSVRRSGTQTITSGVATKVVLTIESFDVNSKFDAVTNYRFQPTRAGYYQLNWNLYCYGAAGTITTASSGLYKNGVADDFGVGSSYEGSGINGFRSVGSSVVYCNGVGDYYELYGTIVATTPAFLANSNFSGSLIQRG